MATIRMRSVGFAVNGSLMSKNHKPGRKYKIADNVFAQIGLNKRGEKTCSFVFGYTAPATKKSRQMGLGYLRPGCSMAEERAKLKTILQLVEQARTDLAAGLDPKDARDHRVRVETAASTTLADVLDGFVADRLGHVTDGYRARWATDLRNHCPDLLTMPISAIRKKDIADALRPAWNSINVTARQMLQRVHALFEYALALDLIAEDVANPARGVSNLLPNHDREVRPHKALPHQEIPAFMRELAERERYGDAVITAWAIRWIILTCVRCTEGAHARWDEIDLADRLWTVPASRMKYKRAHEVPLSSAAIDLLGALPRGTLRNGQPSPFLFHGPGNKPVTATAVGATMIRMRPDGTTLHGCRSSFRDWVSDSTDFDGITAEMALAHQVGSKTERSYHRTRQLEKRRTLMEAWGCFCVPDVPSELYHRTPTYGLPLPVGLATGANDAV